MIPGSHFTRDRLFYSRRIGAPPPHSPELARRRVRRRARATARSWARSSSPARPPAACPSACWRASPAARRAAIDALRASAGARPRRPSPTSSSGARSRTSAAATPTLGLIVTSVDRRHRGRASPVPARARLTRGGRLRRTTSATATWLVEANAAASHLRGTAAAIDEVQTSSARYFQRPGQRPRRLRPHAHLASAATAAPLRLRRTGKNANLSLPDRRRLALARLRDQRPRLHEPRRRDQPVRLGRVPDPQPLLDLPAAWS